MAFDELKLVDWLKTQQSEHHGIDLGIGDDMAQLSVGSTRPLFSCDMLLDGVHFDSRRHSMERIGRKAVACNLSDCAAMGVRPIAVNVSVALPISLPESDVHSLFRGIFQMAAEFDVGVSGGDTARWSHPLAIDVAIIAEPYPERRPILRSGAKIGDRLYVTGKLGGSLLGRHLSFRPRVAEARQLVHSLGARLHAMIDVSDGLALDLWRVCEASHTGATVDETLLEAVIHEDARLLSDQDGRPPLEHVLSDGEDFELLLAVDGDVGDTGVPLWPVGVVSPGTMLLLHLDGSAAPLTPAGYVH